MSVPINITSGSEIHNDKSAKVICYWVPSEPQHKTETTKEVYIAGTQKLRNTGVVKNGSNTAIPAVTGHTKDRGVWIRSDYTVEDMTLLKFYVCINKGWNVGEAKANIYIRMRADAPLQEITIPLLGESQSNLSEVTITGRFDIVHDIDEVKLAGATVIPHFASLTSQSRFSRVARLREIAPQIAAIPVIVRKTIVTTDSEGNATTKSVKAKKRVRRTLGF